MTRTRLDAFRTDIQRARDLIGLGQSLGALTHGRVDSSDLFRAAIVQAVSALDQYVHGIVLDLGVEILLGTRAPTPNSRVGLPFHAVERIVSAATQADREIETRTHLAQRLSTETFQRPDDIANALALVGIGRLWKSAFPNGPEQAKTSLGLVVTRRNRIVHQCDSDPLTPGSVTPLDAQGAADAVRTVEHVVMAIDTLY